MDGVLGHFQRVSKHALEDYKGAISDYNEALKLDFSTYYAYNNRGFSKYHLGLYEEALIDCNFSIKLDSNNSYAYFYRGLIKLKLKNKESGCQDLYKAKKLNYPKEELHETINKHCK